MLQSGAVALRIDPEYIGFDSLAELSRFISDQQLGGGFELAEPIKDNAGNVLVKERILVKESSLRRLETMEGNYTADFRVHLSPDLMKQLRASLTKGVLSLLDKSDMHMVKHLFDATQVNYPPFIQNAFATGVMFLTFFKVRHDDPDFFDHCAKLGLLTLGTIVQKQFGISKLHRYAFLSGFLSDIPLASTVEWKGPISEERRIEINKQASDFALKLGMPPEIIQALKEAPVIVSRPQSKNTPIQIFDPAVVKVAVESEETATANQTPVAPASAATDPGAAEILTEVVRLALYIHESWKQLSAESNVEKLVTMIAYNGERGYFHRDLVEIMIERFKEYEQVARRMMRVAAVEKKCLHPPSAWAYPKPRTAQIICRHFKTECPKIISGWDLHIVSPQESFGWLGLVLDSGTYPKCQLEKELSELD